MKSAHIDRKFQFLCECNSAIYVHYLIDTEEGQTQFDHCGCENNDTLRKLTEKEAYWFPAEQQGVKVMKYIICTFISPIYSFIYPL